MPELIVFAGPCRNGRHLRSHLADASDLALWGPARRGDVLRALACEPSTLVLLDGCYFDVLAVSHKELLYALDAGVRVIGGASMGALRAAELDRFGMTGVGTVYDWYRHREIDGDDEVAILHAPEENGYRTQTVALVEVRWALRALAEEEQVEVAGGEGLLHALKELSFSCRHGATVASLAHDHLGERRAKALLERLAEDSIKDRDAVAALELARLPAATSPRSRAHRPNTATSFLAGFRSHHLGGGDESAPTFLEAWRMTQVLHPAAPEFVAAVRRRYLLASTARLSGLSPCDEAQRRWLRVLGGHRRPDGALWLPRQEYRDEVAEELLAQEARRHFKDNASALSWLEERASLAGSAMELLEVQEDALPPWHLVRAFVFSTALVAALAVAREALVLHRAFQVWRPGARICTTELRQLLAELWRCPLGEVEERGKRRGLFPSALGSVGLDEAAERVAYGERLRAPLNDYPRCRDTLQRSRLTTLFASGDSLGGGAALATGNELGPPPPP